MIPTSLIPSALGAVIKFGRVTLDAYEQNARDQKILIPYSPGGVKSFQGEVRRLFTGAESQLVKSPDGKLEKYWDHTNKIWKDDAESREKIFAEAKRLLAEEDIKFSSEGRFAFDEYAALKQWGDKEGPLSPLVRVGLALVDIVSNYVSAYPEKVGLGNNSQRFVSALASNISTLLPDYTTDKKLEPEDWANLDFTDQVLMVSMRAGLNAARETVDIHIDEIHFQQLFLNVTQPLVDSFKSSGSSKIDWHETRDQLLDPMMQAAIKTVADHQQAFLGDKFDPNEAVGAVTKSFLVDVVASEEGVYAMLGEQGAVKLYAAALNVVAQRPELFIEGQSQSDKLARDLIVNSSQALLKIKPIWKGKFKTLGHTLLISSIETVSNNKALIFSQDKPLDHLAVSLFSQLVEGIKIGSGNEIEEFLTPPIVHMLREAMRSLLQQVVEQPQLLTSDEVREDVEKIVAAVAAAMVQDKKLLLTAKDWPDIVAVAVYEASRNPGRLFKLDDNDPLEELGSKIISGILTAAYEDYKVTDSPDKFLAFGETLRTSIVTALQHASGNVKNALQNLDALETLVRNLNQVIKQRSEELGAAEWQTLFRKFVSTALDQGKVDSFTVEELNKLINSGIKK